MPINPNDIQDQAVRAWYVKKIATNRRSLDNPISICIHCTSNVDYLRMACLCIASLRQQNIQIPIILMADNRIKNREECNFLSALGVHIFEINCHIRQWCYEIVFSHFPQIQTLINIDCDQFLYNYYLNFEALSDPQFDLQWFEKNNWETESAYDVLKSREMMFYSTHKDTEQLFGIDYAEYADWCKNRRWIWGNFVILHRNILQSKFWQTTRRMGFVYPDDEGAYMIARFLGEDINQRYLNRLVKQHIGSLTILEECPEISTLVHYAGPNWKKESDPIFRRLWRSFFGNPNF